MLAFLFYVILFVVVIVGLILAVPLIRRHLVTNQILKIFRKMLPQISQTEQEALDAGTVWWEGDLFSGKPDWKKLLAYPKPQLTPEEQAFLDGPVEQLCVMLDEWKITHELKDLPPEVWQFVKEKGFFGLIIPKQYGGYGFSALAHSEVVMKIGSRSGTAAVTVMVPNSLGPAELLLHYGTENQKEYYLPRLAKGLEVPCFALTSPEAGSDAGAMPDFGVVCRGEYDGKADILGMRVTWEKRYITLGPVATILGLAFKLYDPDRLLGKEEDLGITLALIPTNTPGVNIGRRHYPLNGAFQNGPNSGKEVFIPMDWIIGGQEGVGQGWRMLMNCLSVGRAISLPATSVGAAKLAARTCGAYSRVRTQFKTPIGYFEGVEEALGRIGGNTYMMDAARVLTIAAVDLGEKPSVASAIVKYHLTERGRLAINDAMDIHGGKGICIGPRNYLGRTYQQIPVSITVEGANILTRNMIIFGQGALRCHPYLLKEVNAAHDKNQDSASLAFDEALIGHAKFILRNTANSFVYALFGNHIKDNAPENCTPETAAYYRQLARFSASFAFIADIGLIRLGGSLKRRERLSARLGDILSMLYLCSATLKRFEDDGRPNSDLPLLHWSMQDGIYRMQQAFDEFLANIPGHFTFVWLLRVLVFPLGKRCRPPLDVLAHEVARLMMAPGAVRDRLTAGIHVPTAEHEPMAELEQALQCVIECGAIEAKLREAVKLRKISDHGDGQIDQAVQLNVITEVEASLLNKLKDLRSKVIKVDDFKQDFEREAKSSNNESISATRSIDAVMSAKGAINANYVIDNDIVDETDDTTTTGKVKNSAKTTSRKKSNPVTEDTEIVETVK
ncbi:acyl-CoA dehydrogenase [Nitrosomonas supralitoralis]|uniref:Acyl-coenzyme A dehydrogenase n=1 Tax=Nitrosomonas supralitoralis TaxID=2116706 RepID=A0A2P7NZR2_9PROT|nr:acyl-CoA dehydrogenase [Nitrosomonas supralitoralis]PSJ18928.1 acyl-CoA dehydrogenase [Nitrosomonas supralitoralis]